jgi:hypothetical protein
LRTSDPETGKSITLEEYAAKYPKLESVGEGFPEDYDFGDDTEADNKGGFARICC